MTPLLIRVIYACRFTSVHKVTTLQIGNVDFELGAFQTVRLAQLVKTLGEFEPIGPLLMHFIDITLFCFNNFKAA